MQRLATTAAAACGGAAVALIGVRLRQPPTDDHAVQAEATTLPPATLAERSFCKYGNPSDEHIIIRQGYCSSVSYRLRIPNWVAEKYSSTDVDAEGADRKHSNFSPDEDVPAEFRADNADYRGSMLSRGHMAPAGAHKQSQEALNETFKLSANILPQELSNNGSDWLRLERWSRALTKEYTEVYVVSGPLFLPVDDGKKKADTAKQAVPKVAVAPVADDGKSAPAAAAAPPEAAAPSTPANPSKPPHAPPIRRRIAYDVIGAHAVAVPTHLFKVVLAERPGADGVPERRLSAFILPNGPVRGHPDLDEFVVPLARVERESGLELFAKLGDARHDLTQMPPLCAGANGRCGVGAMDGRIIGWKRLGHLKMADDCQSLMAAWGDVPPKAEAFGLLKRTFEDQAGKYACPLPKKADKDKVAGGTVLSV